MGEYKAYRYRGGSDRGQEVCAADDRDEVFNTAEMDANAILAALNKKAAEDQAKVPTAERQEPCHMISDDKARVIEIRRDSDGLLMYYYDVL